MADLLRVERSGPVLEFVINRPEVRNAINREVAEGIAQGLDRLDADDELRVGVITAEGPHFSAGMDLDAFGKGEVPDVEGSG